MVKGFYSVSRIEEGIAVLECPDGQFKEFELKLMPEGVNEGNVLYSDDGINFNFDDDEEKKRKKRLLDLQNSIFG